MKFSISIEEIYPSENVANPLKNKEMGTVHAIIDFGFLQVEIKNIFYCINKKKKVFVSMPNHMYHQDTPDKTRVPSISFSDPEIFREIRKKVTQEVLMS